MAHTSKSTLAIVSAVLLLPLLQAEPAANPTGHWNGAIHTPTRDIKIEIDLTTTAEGELAGVYSNPGDHLTGLPLGDLSVDGRWVHFQIKGRPKERVFLGTLAADGASLSGQYSESGFSIPFSLTRAGEARIEPVAKSAAVSKEMEGVWNGTIAAGQVQQRVVLTMANQPDGTSKAVILNLDEGLEVPVSQITQQASNLTLGVKAVGGSYTGRLNAEATELVGVLTEAGQTLPLTFRRAPSQQ